MWTMFRVNWSSPMDKSTIEAARKLSIAALCTQDLNQIKWQWHKHDDHEWTLWTCLQFNRRQMSRYTCAIEWYVSVVHTWLNERSPHFNKINASLDLIAQRRWFLLRLRPKCCRTVGHWQGLAIVDLLSFHVKQTLDRTSCLRFVKTHC